MSLVGVISMIGAVVGIEFILRVVDYLYTRKVRSLGSHKKSTKHSKAYKKNRKTIETY
jgi:hypothetical protein